MDEDLAANVRGVLQQSGDELETVRPGSRERVVQAIAAAFGNHLKALDGLATEDVRKKRANAAHPDGYDMAWYLLWDGTNTLLAAFTLMQRGYATETLAVMRTALERLACAIVLFDNPHLIPRFMAGKLKDLGTRAMGPAGEVVPGLPSAWGLHSEIGSHVGKDNVGTGFITVVPGQGTHQLHMAIGGRFPTADEEREAWAEYVNELCDIVDKLFTPAAEQILFNPRRKTAVFKGT